MARVKTQKIEVDSTNELRGIYRGPSLINTKIKIPKNFIPDAPTQRLMFDIVRLGYQLSCDTITHPRYWQKEWTECPLCGGCPDDDGLWIHRGEV